MGDEKKGFVLYKDWCSTVLEIMADESDPLTHEELGMLMQCVFFFQVNGEDTSKELPKHIRFLFKNVVDVFNRDLEKWEKTREKRRESGKKGGLAKASKPSKCYDLLGTETVAKVEKPKKTNALKENALKENKPPAIAKVAKVAGDVQKYGEYQNVKLTALQFQQTVEYYNGDMDAVNFGIKLLDEYIENQPEKGKKYKNHSLVLKNWVKNEVFKKQGFLSVVVAPEKHTIAVEFENCPTIHEADFVKNGLKHYPEKNQKIAYETWCGFSEGERFCAMAESYNRMDVENHFKRALRIANDAEWLETAIKKNKKHYDPKEPVIYM